MSRQSTLCKALKAVSCALFLCWAVCAGSCSQLEGTLDSVSGINSGFVVQLSTDAEFRANIEAALAEIIDDPCVRQQILEDLKNGVVTTFTDENAFGEFAGEFGFGVATVGLGNLFRAGKVGSFFGKVRPGRLPASPHSTRALQKFFPPNQGFLGTPERRFLFPGERIDRFGGTEASRFFSPAGTPIPARSLPPGVAQQPLRRFEVVKPFEVDAGTVAPAFGQSGFGTQFRTPVQLETLID